MKRNRIALVGRIKGNPDWAPNFNKMESVIKSMRPGVEVINPVDTKNITDRLFRMRGLGVPTDADYLACGLSRIYRRARMLVAGKFWRLSRGAVIEVLFAEYCGIPYIEFANMTFEDCKNIWELPL